MTYRNRLTRRHPCGTRTLPGMPCPTHPTGHTRAVSPDQPDPTALVELSQEILQSLRTPIGLDAPAQSTEDYIDSTAQQMKIDRLENQVRILRSKINSTNISENEKFESGVKMGREAERVEIAERLDRNAESLTGNGTSKDTIVRSVLRALAAQLRGLERTG